MDQELYLNIALPLLIFLSRIADVSIGTVRIILVSKSYKLYAAILGFFEVLIWIVAIGQLLGDLNNFVTYFSYALGFAAGTYIGIIIEEKIAIGSLLLQVITKNKSADLVSVLRDQKVRTFEVQAEGAKGDVKILYIIVTRKNYKKVASIIEKHDPSAFFAVEDINVVKDELEHILESASSGFRLSNILRREKNWNQKK